MRLLLTLLTFGLAAALIVKHRHLSSSEREVRFEMTGYTQIVNRAVTPHLCVARQADSGEPDPCALFARRPDPDPDPADLVLRWRFDDPRLASVYRTFEERSPLRFDLADPSRFAFTRPRSGVVEMRLLPTIHQQPLPFSEESEWRGVLSYGASHPLPKLVVPGSQAYVLFHPARRGRRPCLPPLRISGLRQRTSRETDCADWFLLGQPALRVWAYPIGSPPKDRVGLVVSRPPRSAGGVFLNGEPLDPEVLRRLVGGDWLELRAGRRTLRYLVEYEQEGIISAMRATTEGFRREPPRDASVESIAHSVIDSMNQAVIQAHSIADKNAVAVDAVRRLQNHDVHLTLNRTLQFVATESLQLWLDSIKTGGEGAPWRMLGHPVKPPRAALLVMRLDTGEVLAAASYPGRNQMAAQIEQARATLRAPTPAGRRLRRYHLETLQRTEDMLTRNHNWSPHQIGSVTKPLLALSVAMGGGTRDVLNDTVACGGDRGTYHDRRCVMPADVDGYPIGCFEDGRHGLVDFTAYLARSCHTFQFHLGAIALRQLARDLPDPAGACEDGVWLKTLFGNVANDTAFGRWRRYYDASWNQRDWAPSYRFVPTVWRSLGEQVDRTFAELRCETGLLPGRRRRVVGTAFDTRERVSRLGPPTVYFQGEAWQRCVEDYGSWLKGGGTNRWTNLTVAQALARLATGVRVEAHLDQGAATAHAPLTAPGAETARFETVRAGILRGMGSGVTDAAGTLARGIL